RVADYGYDYCLVAENIAYRSSSSELSAKKLARGFMKSWKKSTGHRKNLLDPDVTEIGLGVAGGKDGQYYAVQDFGRPKSAAIHFEITNRTDSAVDYSVDGKRYNIQPRYIMTHQRCRPPRLTFQLKNQQASSTKPEQTFHPREGSHYVIRQNRSGKVTVEEASY